MTLQNIDILLADKKIERGRHSKHPFTSAILTKSRSMKTCTLSKYSRSRTEIYKLSNSNFQFVSRKTNGNSKANE